MTLFSAIVFSVFTSVMFFIKGQFFTGSGTTDLLTYFSSAPYICIIVIPALCYKKSIAIYNDFIPVKRIIFQLKYFARIFLQYSIIIAMMFPVCILVNLFGSIDAGQVFTGIFCLLLYGAAIISLCLFINELLPNGIAAFVINALLLAIFNSIHVVPLYFNLNNFASSICKNLSFAWHFDAASKGIIDTRDIHIVAQGSPLIAKDLLVCLIEYALGLSLVGSLLSLHGNEHRYERQDSNNDPISH